MSISKAQAVRVPVAKHHLNTLEKGDVISFVYEGNEARRVVAVETANATDVHGTDLHSVGYRHFKTEKMSDICMVQMPEFGSVLRLDQVERDVEVKFSDYTEDQYLKIGILNNYYMIKHKDIDEIEYLPEENVFVTFKSLSKEELIDITMDILKKSIKQQAGLL